MLNEGTEFITESNISLKIILKQNYFQFDNKIHQQNKELAMDSPLSSTLAVTCLQEMDKPIFNQIKACDNHGIWIWHADDGLYTTKQTSKINL